MVIVPPGGFAAFAQHTPASKAQWFRPGRGSGGRRRKRRQAKAARSGPRRKKNGGRKMKFGSPAWQKMYKVGKFAKKRR